MKVLMKFAVDKLYNALVLRDRDLVRYDAAMKVVARLTSAEQWDNPTEGETL